MTDLANNTEDVKQIKIEDVIKLLDEGKSRKEIAIALGMTQADVKRLFQDPDLKGLKRRTAKVTKQRFVLVKPESNEQQVQLPQQGAEGNDVQDTTQDSPSKFEEAISEASENTNVQTEQAEEVSQEDTVVGDINGGEDKASETPVTQPFDPGKPSKW